MNVGRLLEVQFIAVGFLIAPVAVPLALGLVPPNDLYGFRAAQTLSDETIWYAANRVAGSGLLAAGLLIVTASFAVMVWGTSWAATTRMSVNVFVTVGAVGLAVAHSMLALGRL